MRTVHIAGLLILAVGAVVPAQAKTTAADVIKQVEKTFARVRDYKAEANMSIDSPQLHVEDSKATIYFKRPDKIKVVAKEGFAVIPSEAVPGNPAKWIRDNFNAAYEGGGNYKGAACHVLKLVGKTPTVPATMKLWVEKRRGLILGTHSNSDGMDVKSDWSYKLIDGKYWLPSQLKIEMSGTMAGAVYDPHKAKVEPPKSGKGTAVVKLTDYKVNKGVPDAVFKKRE